MSKTRILEAVRKLDLATTREVLGKEPSLIGATDGQGRNLLFIACSANCKSLGLSDAHAVRMVGFLLGKGMDIHARLRTREGDGVNCVWFAVARGRNRKVIKMLLERGAAAEGLFAAGWMEDIPSLELLLAGGAIIDESIDDETPFLHSWKNGRFRSAQFLVRRGANVNFQDSKGKTALHYGVEKEYAPARLRFLVENGASADVIDRDGVSPRLKASRKRSKTFLRALG